MLSNLELKLITLSVHILEFIFLLLLIFNAGITKMKHLPKNMGSVQKHKKK